MKWTGDFTELCKAFKTGTRSHKPSLHIWGSFCHPALSLVSDPASPRENGRSEAETRPKESKALRWTDPLNHCSRGAQCQWHLKSPKTWLSLRDIKIKFELSVICKFRGHVFNTLWKVTSVCKCADLLLPHVCMHPP